MTSKPFSLPAVTTLLTFPIAFACSGDDGPHHIITVDAPGQQPDAMQPCLAAASYTPTFGSDDMLAEDYPAMGSGSDATIHYQLFSAPLNAEDPADYLFVDLWAEYGAFAGGDIHTGSFPLTGDDSAYSSCGACVSIAADATDTNVGQWYMASGGLLNLTSVTTRLTGNLQNVTLLHVRPDPEGGPSDSVVGDCMVNIPSASFDTPITMGSARIAIPVSPKRAAATSARVLRQRYY